MNLEVTRLGLSKNQIHLYLGNSVPNSRAALSGSVMGLKNIGGLDISAMVQNSDRSVALWYISSSLRLPVSAFHVQLFKFIHKICEFFTTEQSKSQKIYIFCLFTKRRIVIHFRGATGVARAPGQAKTTITQWHATAAVFYFAKSR